MMKQRNVPLVPTIYVLDYIIEQGEKTGIPPDRIAKARALQAERDRAIRAAFGAGLTIAFGSDTIFPHETANREFARMVRLGLSPMGAIKAATANAAGVLGIEKDTGTLEVGKRADVVVLDLEADHLVPLYNPISHLAYAARSGDVRTVVIDGQVVLEDRRLLTLDEAEARRQVRVLATAIAARHRE